MKTERDRLFTVEDVATETGLSASTIRSYARDGLITPQRGWNTQTGRSPKKSRRGWSSVLWIFPFMSIPPWPLRNTHIESGSTIGGHATGVQGSENSRHVTHLIRDNLTEITTPLRVDGFGYGWQRPLQTSGNFWVSGNGIGVGNALEDNTSIIRISA